MLLLYSADTVSSFKRQTNDRFLFFFIDFLLIYFSIFVRQVSRPERSIGSSRTSRDKETRQRTNQFPRENETNYYFFFELFYRLKNLETTTIFDEILIYQCFFRYRFSIEKKEIH